MNIIGLLVALLIFAVLVWAARTICAAFNLPPQIQAVVTVIIVLIFVLWVVQNLSIVGPIAPWRLR